MKPNGTNQSPLPPVTSLLPPARARFLVLTDTHLVDERAVHTAEFRSRLKQNERVRAALRVVAGAQVDGVVHVGDLVQDYPGSPLHGPLLDTAVAQLRALVPGVHIAAGNTDVGDPHDPASPAVLVSAESMSVFGQAVGSCWSTFDLGPVRGILLTGSLLGSGLKLEAEQWDWLEQELAEPDDRPTVMFFHYPLFLRSADDPDIGNYDTINEPARSRMIALIEAHDVAGIFTGHSHFSFLNLVGKRRVRAFGVPSTSFTRPGFSELFSSAAPPDRGRDDVPKLGMHLVQVHDDGLRVHQVRTGTLTERLAAPGGDGARPVVSCVSKDVPGSPLGIVLRHRLAQLAEVPDTFPSVVRQPVRNDYPVLGCLELGARHVSVTVPDVVDPHQRERLRLLREEGVGIVVRTVWAPGRPPEVPPADCPVDDLELVLLGRTHLTTRECEWLAGLRPSGAVVLSTMMRRENPAGELPRWRYGFTPEEAVALDEMLAGVQPRALRVLVEAGGPQGVRACRELAAAHPWRSVRAVDTVLALDPDPSAVAGLGEALLEASVDAGGRIFVDGLTELDRTLNLSPGLLDRQCNPQPAFHTLRVLNSLVHAVPGVRVERSDAGYAVHRPGLESVVELAPDPARRTAADGAVTIRLVDGMTLAGPPTQEADWPLVRLLEDPTP